MWSLWVGNDIMVSYSVTTISSLTSSPTPSFTSSSNTIPISSSSWWRCDHSGWPSWFHRSNTISSSQQFFQLFPMNSAEKEHFVLVSTNGLCSGKAVNINWKTGKQYFGKHLRKQYDYFNFYQKFLDFLLKIFSYLLRLLILTCHLKLLRYWKDFLFFFYFSTTATASQKIFKSNPSNGYSHCKKIKLCKLLRYWKDILFLSYFLQLQSFHEKALNQTHQMVIFTLRWYSYVTFLFVPRRSWIGL